MERLGGYVIFFAIGSAILSQTNYQFRLMSWMNDMGNGAWLVRAVMLIVGVAMVASGQFTRRPAAATAPSVAGPMPAPMPAPQPAPIAAPQPAPMAGPMPAPQPAPMAAPIAATTPTSPPAPMPAPQPAQTSSAVIEF